MAKPLVNIEIDQASARRLVTDLKRYDRESAAAIKRAVIGTAIAIEADAKNRLKGLLGSVKHIVTGRLRASVHWEDKSNNSFEPNDESKGGDGNLDVSVADDEAVVGTNVDYASKIEFDYDSFLQYAAVRQSSRFAVRLRKEFKNLDKKFRAK